jgi:hypothetical protein
MKNTSRLLSTVAALAFIAVAPGARSAVYDLNATGTVIVPTTYGSAIFTLDYTQPAGTGVFEPFMTLQTNGSGGIEEGYNAGFNNFDSKREPTWNKDIQLSSLKTVTISGVTYYSFLIDINEPNAGNKSLISLDSLKIFTSSIQVATEAGFSQLGAAKFDLDLPEDTFIKYDDANSGSGQGDIAFFVPTSAFLSAGANDYIYMYQHWGSLYEANKDFTAQGGFEETAIGAGVSFTPVPETSALLPLLGVLGVAIAGPYLRRAFSA